MAGIRALGYLGVRDPEPMRWVDFSRHVLAMDAVQDTQECGDRVLLRMDDRPFRVAVAAGPPGVDYIGYETQSAAELDEVVGKLAAAGITVHEADPAIRDWRQVTRLIQFRDPGGYPIEVFYGSARVTEPFQPPRDVRFVTGPLGMGHVVLGYANPADIARFYCDVLGFRVSDVVAVGGAEAYFLHCNARHHSLAVAPDADAGPEGRLYHFMAEVADISAVGRAIDAAEAHPAGLSRTLGMHTNDEMVSCYLNSPAGFEIEYGYGARMIDDKTWLPARYTRTSHWGHRRMTER